MTEELINRLVRNTISNMISACHRLEYPRGPTTVEMEDMSRALCRKYPCLGQKLGEDGKSFVKVPTEELQKLVQDKMNQHHVSCLISIPTHYG